MKLRFLGGAANDTDPNDGGNSSFGNGTNSDTLPPPAFSTIITFLVISSIISALIEGFFPRKLLRIMPQPVLLMILYIIAGAIAGPPFDVQIEADIILTVFLPALLTNEALKIKTTPFFKSMVGLLWLIGPGLFIGATITAVYPFQFFPPEDRFNWNLSMAVGGMIATTDPIAVMMFLSEVMAPRRLSAMVSGESLLNDATSIICVTLFLGLNTGIVFTAGDMVFFIFNQVVFSVLFGVAVGAATMIVLRVMRVLDAHTLFAFTIAMPYCVFTVTTYYFKDPTWNTGGSGVLSMIPVGLFFNAYMAGLAREEQVLTIQEFWETLSFLATSWLYSLTGLLVGIDLADKNVQLIDWAALLGFYLWVVLARFIVIFLSLPVFIYAPGGYGFNFKEAILLAWGGLRGSVGLLLALVIKGNPSVSRREGQLVQFMMAGIVVLVQFQGITFPILLKRLNVIIVPNARVVDTMRTKMLFKTYFVLTRAGVEPGQAKDMMTVHTKKRGQLDGETTSMRRFTTRRHISAMQNDPDMVFHEITKEWVSKSVLNDKRRRLLQAQRATYNNLISRELISRAAWLIATRGLELQLDMDEISLNQWEFLLKKTPRMFCNNFGRHSSEVQALLSALFARDMKNFLDHKNEVRRQKLQHSSRSRFKNRLGGVITKPKFDDLHENDKKSCWSRWFGFTGPDDEELLMDMRDREFGIDCEEALTFGYVSWAFLIAQNQSGQLLLEMFRLDDNFTAFEAEHRALKAEIEMGKSQPALYLDTLANYFPDIARKIKSAQVVAEVKDQVYGYIHELSNGGLIEMQAMKRLMRDADKIVRVIKKLDFPLEPPYSVGVNGVDVLKCPNYHPFVHSDILQRFHIEDFENLDDPALQLQEALEEKPEPMTTGFWVKRGKDVSDATSEATAVHLAPSDQPRIARVQHQEQGGVSQALAYPDAPVSDLADSGADYTSTMQEKPVSQRSAQAAAHVSPELPPADRKGFGVDASLVGEPSLIPLRTAEASLSLADPSLVGPVDGRGFGADTEAYSNRSLGVESASDGKGFGVAAEFSSDPHSLRPSDGKGFGVDPSLIADSYSEPPADGQGFGLDPSLLAAQQERGMLEEPLSSFVFSNSLPPMTPVTRLVSHESSTSATNSLSKIPLVRQLSSQKRAQSRNPGGAKPTPSSASAPRAEDSLLEESSYDIEQQQQQAESGAVRKRSNLAKVELMRQLSGSTWPELAPGTAGEQQNTGEGTSGEETVASLDALEYSKLLSSRPAVTERASSFYAKKME